MAYAKTHDLTTGSIPLLIRTLAIPAAVGYFFNTLFNVVDTIYAGLLSASALAALGASFPIFFLVIAAMGGFSSATTALVASKIGRSDADAACCTLRTACILAVAAGMGIAVLGEVLAGPVVRFLGIGGEAADLAIQYIRPILFGAPAFLLNAVLAGGLMAQGNTKTYRNALIAGTLANIALNPVLMFGLGLGIAGLAFATIAIQIATVLYLRHELRRTRLGAAVGLIGSAWEPAEIGLFLRQALPASGNLALIGSSIFVYTYFIGQHGEAALAAYTVGLRIEQLILLPTVGLNAAAIAIIGQNFGAGDMERIRVTVRTTLLYGLAVMATGAALILVFRGPLLSMFTDDPTVIAIGKDYLFVAALIEIAYVFNMIGAGTLQGIQRPIYGFYVTVGRSLLAPPLVMFLVDRVFGLGLNGMFWGIFAINWLSAAVMIAVVENQLRCRCGLRFTAPAPMPAAN